MKSESSQIAAHRHGPPVSSAADVVVIHETDGRKYMEALQVLAQRGNIASVKFHGASVLRRTAHALLRERRSIRVTLRMTLENLAFRLQMPFLRNKVVVLALAPWDWRLPIYMVLLKRNNIIYHSSWPWWDGARVPHPYHPLNWLFKAAWRRALSSSRLRVVAVTPSVRTAVAGFAPTCSPHVISHVVSEAFFSKTVRRGTSFRLLFVGELLEKKGFGEFITIAERLGADVEIEIIGDGPLRSLAEAAAARPGCRWHGRVVGREAMARILSGCQVLVSPAHKTRKWEELFGMAILEGMAAGLPCIVTDHVGPRSFIRHGHNGMLVEEGDLDAFVGHLQELRTQPLLWEAISKAAKETASQYRMSVVAARWHEVIGAFASPEPL